MLEKDVFPYEATALRGERLLVIAPHPDDEVIGCGGLMAQHLREKRQVRIVTATDGTKATSAEGDLDQYRIRRESESKRALEILGGTNVEFLALPDRDLAGNKDRLADSLRKVMLEFEPDLVALPSPVEIHPDHLALAEAFCSLLQRDEDLAAALGFARVAFFEVSHPIRPNTLVDITEVAETKYEAIAAHVTQLAVRDYVAYARGLNAYRAMSLSPTVRFAEAYWVMELTRLRTMSFSALRRAVGESPPIEVVRETVPISVVIRTRNRPALLQQAVDSVRASGYPAEVVVVNDGGARPEGLDGQVRLVEHASSRGRSEAMNSGVRAAGSAYLAFLDDDDLFYPEHLSILAAATQQSQYAAWYTDAVSVFMNTGESGTLNERSRLRLYSQDFDAQLLLVDNYIPLPTVLTHRESFLKLGGFDSQFDLFEDWDFLLRLSAQGDFLHVPRVTCEIRHVEGSGSIVMSTPEGTERFRAAKTQIWRKHEGRLSLDVFADVFERNKSRLNTLHSQHVEEKGRSHHNAVDLVRLEREKNELLAQMGALHEKAAQTLMGIRQLEGANSELRDVVEKLRDDTRLQAREISVHMTALADFRHQVAEYRNHVAALEKAFADSQTNVQAFTTENGRLQALLDMIYRSRTWKLHSVLEKLRGRG